MKQKDIAFQLGISEAYVTQLKKVIAFFLTRIRAILGPKTIKQPRKCPFYRKRLIFRYDRKIPDYFSVAGAP